MKHRMTLVRANSARLVLISLLLGLLVAGCDSTSVTPTAITTQVSNVAPATAIAAPSSAALIGATFTPMQMTGGTPAIGTPGTLAIGQEADTASYKMKLHIGPTETMLTPDQAKGATSGEVMVSGSMNMGTGGTPNYHLEVQITDIKSGMVITDKSVKIELASTTTNQITSVDVAAMYGVDEGPSEIHFGNNVAIAPGDYTVKVGVAGEVAQFKVTIP